MTDNTKFIGPCYFKFIGLVYFLLLTLNKLNKLNKIKKLKKSKIPDFEKMFQIYDVSHRNTSTGGVSA